MTNDLISRSELLAEIDQERKRHIDSGNYGAEHLMVHSLRRLVEDAPAVDAAPVVCGRWEAYGDMPGYLRCSECKDVYIYEEWLKNGEWSFCPHCGAKMDKEAVNAQE